MGVNSAIIETLENDLKQSGFFYSIPDFHPGDVSILTPVVLKKEHRFGNLLRHILDPLKHPVFSLEAIQVLYDLIVNQIGAGKIFELDIVDDNFQIGAEVRTHENGRIDFVVWITDEYLKDKRAIIIELKLDSDIQNDLKDYYNSIDTDKKVGVILSLKDTIGQIGGSPFIQISLTEFLTKFIAETRKSAVSSREDTFLKELEYYLDDLSKSFYSPNTNLYGGYLLNSSALLIRIFSVFQMPEDDDRNRFLSLNKLFLKNIQYIRDFVKINIQDYLEFFADKRFRKKHHVKDECNFYLKGEKYSHFPELVRLRINYSFIENFNPSLRISVEVDVDKVSQIVGADSFDQISAALQALTPLNGWFNNRNKSKRDWNDFFDREVTAIADISQFDTLVNNVFEDMLVPVERAIYGILSPHSIIFNTFSILADDQVFKHTVTGSSEFSKAIKETTIENAVQDGFYILSYSMPRYNALLVSIWVNDAFIDDVKRNIRTYGKENLTPFEFYWPPASEQEFQGDDNKLLYLNCIQCVFDLNYENHHQLAALIRKIWDDVQNVLNISFGELLNLVEDGGGD